MKSHEVHRFSRPATWPGPGPVSSWRACIFRPRGPPTWCRTACPRPATGPWIDTPRSSCRERSTRWSTIVAWGRNPGFFSKEVFFLEWILEEFGWRILQGVFLDFIGILLGLYWNLMDFVFGPSGFVSWLSWGWTFWKAGMESTNKGLEKWFVPWKLFVHFLKIPCWVSRRVPV